MWQYTKRPKMVASRVSLHSIFSLPWSFDRNIYFKVVVNIQNKNDLKKKLIKANVNCKYELYILCVYLRMRACVYVCRYTHIWESAHKHAQFDLLSNLSLLNKILSNSNKSLLLHNRHLSIFVCVQQLLYHYFFISLSLCSRFFLLLFIYLFILTK